MTKNTNPSIEARHIVKKFGETTALNNVSLTINDNEFFTLLGPSGCGKTTMLRIIAGFETPSSGQLFLYGQAISSQPPYLRPINTVFQHYALFPHITVLQNVCFGLERQGVALPVAKKRAMEMLELVRLGSFANRHPAQLSGGQQQRVALARALAPSPQVLLLDESLSALDLKLRQAMRLELKQIQRDTGITFIFVTHDQDEALTMSDRIAVMSDGLVQQVGTAQQIYEEPANKFVASFIGETNLMPATLKQDGDNATVNIGGNHRLQIALTDTVPASPNVYISIRPEQITLLAQPTAGTLGALGTLAGEITNLIYTGGFTDITVKLNQIDTPLLVRQQNTQHHGTPQPPLGIGQTVHLQVKPTAIRLLADS